MSTSNPVSMPKMSMPTLSRLPTGNSGQYATTTPTPPTPPHPPLPKEQCKYRVKTDDELSLDLTFARRAPTIFSSMFGVGDEVWEHISGVDLPAKYTGRYVQDVRPSTSSPYYQGNVWILDDGQELYDPTSDHLIWLVPLTPVAGVPTGKHKCTCDIYSLMRVGCKCGGV